MTLSRHEKRKSSRIKVEHRLTGYLVDLERPVGVRDISLGGFSVESDEPLPSGVHVVRLQEGERWSVTVTAASRHNGRREDAAGAPRHIMGFEFEDQTADTQQTLRVLYERLAADQPKD